MPVFLLPVWADGDCNLPGSHGSCREKSSQILLFLSVCPALSCLFQTRTQGMAGKKHVVRKTRRDGTARHGMGVCAPAGTRRASGGHERSARGYCARVPHEGRRLPSDRLARDRLPSARLPSARLPMAPKGGINPQGSSGACAGHAGTRAGRGGSCADRAQPCARHAWPVADQNREGDMKGGDMTGMNGQGSLSAAQGERGARPGRRPA